MDEQKNYLKRLQEFDDGLDNFEQIQFDSSIPEDIDPNIIISTIPDLAFKTATNFTKEEFVSLFSYFDIDMARLQNTRGPRSKLSNMDKFFLLITYLKSYVSYTSLAHTFGLSPTSVQRDLIKIIEALAPIFERIFIEKLDREQQVEKGIGFVDYPEVALILDCSVQKIPRYCGGFNDVKTFFSNKHKIYCVKKEYGHLPNGKVAFVSKFYPGSKHDYNIFLNNITIYKNFLRKNNGNNEYWKIMADKGYEGANTHIPSVLPKKGTNLTSSDIRENSRISRCRIICENFYGRMKVLWGAARLKINKDLKNYDDVIMICVSLTNYHIDIHPLRATDGQNNRRLSISSASSSISLDNNARTE